MFAWGLLVVKRIHFQWVMPLVGLLHLGRKTAARDRLTDLAYRNNTSRWLCSTETLL